MKIWWTLFFSCLLTVSVHADNSENVNNPWDFEISVLPKKTAAELEAERWHWLMSNEVGQYLFTQEGISPEQGENGEINGPQVLLRSIFTDPKVCEQLQQRYADELLSEEQVRYCDMLLVFDLAKRNYLIVETKIYTDKARLVKAEKPVDLVWRKVPAKSVVNSLMNILLQQRKYG